MSGGGDPRPGGASGLGRPGPLIEGDRRPAAPRRPIPRVAVAVGVGLLAAAAWAVLRGILELSVGLLVVSGFGGWGIGVSLRGWRAGRWVAPTLGGAAWVSSLLLTWLVTRVTLPSDRTLIDRLAQTSFLDFTAQQFGLLEAASLALFAGLAWMAVERAPKAPDMGS